MRKRFADMLPFHQFRASAFLSSRMAYSLTLKINTAYSAETLLSIRTRGITSQERAVFICI
jgi:hypothetical protein